MSAATTITESAVPHREAGAPRDAAARRPDPIRNVSSIPAAAPHALGCCAVATSVQGFGARPRAARRPVPGTGRVPAVLARGGQPMFEGQQQADVEALIKNDAEFRQLYQRHKELDKQVLDAELGVLPVDDTTLVRMKKEKLFAKDRLTRLWEQRHAFHH